MGARPLLCDWQARVGQSARQAQEAPFPSQILETREGVTMNDRYRGRKGHKRHGRKGR
jgi:hypothetical protein